LESSNGQPSKRTPNINNPTTTKPNPNLLDGLPHQIHHLSTSRNTPVLRANKLSAQTPQPKQSEAVKLSSIAGLTCLGEYFPLELIVFLSQEKATVGSKKRKFPSTSFAMGLNSDKAEDPMTATPGNIIMTATPGNVTPTATPSNINLTATPSNIIPTATPGNVTPTATPSNINPTATPSNVIPTATPGNVNKVV
jgi:hypothetical protein